MLKHPFRTYLSNKDFDAFLEILGENRMIVKTNNSFRLGDKVKHINGDTIYRIRTMNTKFIIAVDKDGNTKTDYAKKFEKVDQEIQLGAILVVMTIIIFLCLFMILIPIMIDQVEDLGKNFWAARIAWREGKEKYMKYIESHK